MFTVHPIKVKKTWRAYYRGDKQNETVVFAPKSFWLPSTYKTRQAMLQSVEPVIN